MRKNLINMLVEEGDKAGAARESEQLGDQLQMQGNNKGASESYRKAMRSRPARALSRNSRTHCSPTSTARRGAAKSS